MIDQWAVAGLFLAISPLIPAQEPDIQDPTALAEKLTSDGADIFDRGDAVAMADTYAEDGKIYLMNRGEAGYQTRVYDGRNQIRNLYTSLFQGGGNEEGGGGQSRNIVEYARLVGSDLLLIGGTFEPSLGTGLLLQFVQVRIRQPDGRWLIETMRVIPIPRD